MRSDIFDWKDGKVTFWDLDEFDVNIATEEQVEILKEDLAQVCFPGGRILDVGWYPEFNPTGSFAIIIVSNQDWENPIFSERAKSGSELIAAIEGAIASATAGS